MNCPFCKTHVDEHEASRCFDLWILIKFFGFTEHPRLDYSGNFWPKGSYWKSWGPPEGTKTEEGLSDCTLINQIFDRDGNILRANEDNPYGLECEFGRFPKLSDDIGAAWKIVEKLADDDWIISVAWGNGRDGRQYASIQMSIDLFLKADLLNRPITQMDAKAKTVPLVICRTAIKAVHV